jgi:hypothetical protein
MNAPEQSAAAGSYDVVPVSPAALAPTAAGLLDSGYRLALISATHHGPRDGRDEAMHVAYLFLAGPPDSRIELRVGLDPAEPEIPSLARHSFPASRFERELRASESPRAGAAPSSTASNSPPTGTWTA